MTGLHQFHAACIAAGVDTPAPVLRGVEMLRVARDMLDVHPVDVLTLSDDDVRARVVDLSIRAHGVAPRLGSGGLEPGVNEFESDVIAQVREAMADSIEEMTVGLQPAFDKAAAPLVDAVSKYGFTYQTTSDEVIGLGDTKAVDAWRACRAAWAQLQPIANLRRMLSEVFTVSPTATEIRDLYVLLPEGVITGNQVNWSIAFAAGDNWSLEIGGDAIERAHSVSSLDWFALAPGGLHLNTPAEVHEKLTAYRTRLIENLTPVADSVD